MISESRTYSIRIDMSQAQLSQPQVSQVSRARVSQADAIAERVVDARKLAPGQRHAIIFQLFDRLEAGGAIEVVADHDPRPLRYLFDVGYGDRCKWIYLEQGPDVWRVRLQRATAGADT